MTGALLVAMCGVKAAAVELSSRPAETLQTPAGKTTGTTYYVHAQEGDDRASGRSWGQAWRTLDHAVRRGRGGDTIEVRGVFEQSFRPRPTFVPTRPLRFVGPAVIDSRGQGVALELRGVNGYIFEHITFRTMSRDLPEEVQRRSYQVVFLLRGASYNIFRQCTFINAGLGSGKGVVEIMWESDSNVFQNCTAIAESVGEEAYGRRCWLICGASHNLLSNCVSHGSAASKSAEGEGGGIVIYGNRYPEKEGGAALPCIGNRIVGHRSFNARMYGLGITAGSSWCRDNWYENCVVYVAPEAIAGAYANAFATREGCEPEKCQDNGWVRCTIVGGQRGFWVRGMKGVMAEQCVVIAEPEKTRNAFELQTGPDNVPIDAGSFLVTDPSIQGPVKAFEGKLRLRTVAKPEPEDNVRCPGE